VAKDLEAAVKAAQLYAGCGATMRITDAQKLYRRLHKAVERVATRRGMSFSDAHDQITREASRRGPICPTPGKDI
jgi:hypothetical protein